VKTKIAINGFGRIGRNAFKIAFERADLEIVAVNDLSDTKTLAHLLKHDSNYGAYQREVSFDEQNLIVGDHKIKVLAEKDPAKQTVMRRQGTLAEFYLGSVNALAETGELVFASGAESFRLFHPANFLVLLIVVRFVHWLRNSRASLPPASILRELKRTLLFAGLFSIGFAYAAIELFFETRGYVQQFVVLFAALTAVGCAYGLTSFPAAARLPLLLFALPFSATLALSSTTAHIAVGASLALLILLILRLVNLHNDRFVQLVWSRSEVENERERAQAQKRGGGRVHFSLDDTDAEERDSPAAPLPPSPGG